MPEIRTGDEVINEIQENLLTPEETEKLHADLDKLRQRNWDSELTDLYLDVPEDGEKIMKSAVEGIIDTILSTEKRGLLPLHYQLPEVVIQPTEDGLLKHDHAMLAYNNGTVRVTDDRIIIPPEYIEKYANADPDKALTIKATKNLPRPITTNIGTPELMVYTDLSEETAHSIFSYARASRGDSERPKPPSPSQANSIHDYDAQDHESHSLLWRIMTLMDKVNVMKSSNNSSDSDQIQLIEEEIAILLYRVKAANGVRNKEGKTRDSLLITSR